MATWRELVDISSSQTLTNKTHTSPVLDTGVSGTAIKDEDNMASNSATHLATQQSIKAYVDAQVDTADALSEMSDVTITGTPADNEVLAYDSSTSEFINQTAAEVGLQKALTGATSALTETDLTASRALISGTGGKVEVSDVTKTELGYLDGVTSAIQTQLDGKQASGSYAALAGSTSQNFSTNDLAVTGDLTVTGTTISTATENIKIEDSVMTVNSGVASGSTSADGGFIVERGTDGDTAGLVKVDGNNVGIGWDESAGYFRFSSGASTSAFGFVADVGCATNGTSDAPVNDDVGPIGSVHVNTDSDQVFIRVD